MCVLPLIGTNQSWWLQASHFKPIWNYFFKSQCITQIMIYMVSMSMTCVPLWLVIVTTKCIVVINKPSLMLTFCFSTWTSTYINVPNVDDSLSVALLSEAPFSMSFLSMAFLSMSPSSLTPFFSNISPPILYGSNLPNCRSHKKSIILKMEGRFLATFNGYENGFCLVASCLHWPSCLK